MKEIKNCFLYLEKHKLENRVGKSKINMRNLAEVKEKTGFKDMKSKAFFILEFWLLILSKKAGRSNNRQMCPYNKKDISG